MKQLCQIHRNDPVLPERILQFGEGNFLRAFIDWMVHQMNQQGVFNGSVVVVQPLKDGLVDVLNEQDGLYSLFLRGIESGETIEQSCLITSVSRGLNPYQEWESYMETARNPDIRFIVSNTTEAGISYVETALDERTCPATFPSKVTLWLMERFRTFEGTKESGVVILPCELIDRNGDWLKACVLRHAKDWELENSFFEWLEDACYFLNTLVDRIVPGYPRDEAQAMNEAFGYEDKLICSGEVFHLFVIEGPSHLKEELPFHQVGLNVVWCDDLKPYRDRKVGVLNGAHTSSVLAAFLEGLNTVTDMMGDSDFSEYLRRTVFDEVIPALPMDRNDAIAYAEAVMERFKNPFIQHELLSISLNSVSKWKVRVLPSLKNYQQKTNEIPPLLSFSLAALIAFYKGDLRSSYSPRDDEAIVSFFWETWQSVDYYVIVRSVLGNRKLWGEDLNQIPQLTGSVEKGLELILENGMRLAIKEVLNG